MKKNLKYSSLIFINILLIIFCSLFIQIPYENAHAIQQNISHDSVYLGGVPIGIISDSDGLIVSEIINVTGKNGSYSPALQAGFKKGDVIVSVNGEQTCDIYRLNELIQQSTDKINIIVVRNNEKLSLLVNPIFDNIHNLFHS